MVFRIFCFALVCGLGVSSVHRAEAQFGNDDPTTIIDPDTGENTGAVGISPKLCIRTVENVSCKDKFGPAPAGSNCSSGVCRFTCDGPQDIVNVRPDWDTKVDRARAITSGEWGKAGTLKIYRCTVTRPCSCVLNTRTANFECKTGTFQALDSFATPEFSSPVQNCNK
jgi:hypothetical protein